MEIHHPLLVISARVLLEAEHSPRANEVFRRLANLSRTGTHLLLTEAEPDQWFPTRSSDDNVLSAQGRLQQRLQEMGGDLDGVYYVPRSVFTQDRNRLGALGDILVRYSTTADNTLLISSSKAFLKAAERISIGTHAIPKGDTGVESLIDILKELEATRAP